MFTDDKFGFYIVTWDLEKNREISSFNIVNKDFKDPVDFVFKSTGSNSFNYFLTPERYIYDLNYGLPIG